MAYQARARAQSEILQLQQEVFDEVQGDTEHLANAVFGGVDDQPDVGRVSNDRLDQVYRQAFERNDRVFLQREARRDPEQFLKVTERIGVRIPPPQPQPMSVMPTMPALGAGPSAMMPAPGAGMAGPPPVPLAATAPAPGVPIAGAPVVPGLVA